jgi:hypothetical protein
MAMGVISRKLLVRSYYHFCVILYQSGTLHSEKVPADAVRARRIKNRVVQSTIFETSQRKTAYAPSGATMQDIDAIAWEKEIIIKTGWSMKSVREHLSTHLRPSM